MVAKGPFMEILRGTVTESGANTETRQEIKTPVGRSEKLAMLIHKIVIDLESIPQLDDGDSIRMYLKDRDSDGGHAGSDGVFAVFSIVSDVQTSGGNAIKKTHVEYFDPPLPYAKSQVYLGVLGTSQAAAMTASTMIEYSIDKLEQAAFLEALVD